MDSPTTITSDDWVVVKVFETAGKYRKYSLKVEGPYRKTAATEEARYYMDTLRYEPEKAEKNLIFAQARKVESSDR